MKRANATEPLTPDDVAERLSHAAERTLRILMDVRQDEDLMEQVKHSRYLTDGLHVLAQELHKWNISAGGT